MFSSAMWIWGFSTRKDGNPFATLGVIYDQPENDLFVYDMEGFNEFVQHEIELSGSLMKAKEVTIIMSGLLSGVLVHETNGTQVTQELLYAGDGFIETEDYHAWLNTPASEIITPVQDILGNTDEG